jgi:hypothetical protein
VFRKLSAGPSVCHVVCAIRKSQHEMREAFPLTTGNRPSAKVTVVLPFRCGARQVDAI